MSAIKEKKKGLETERDAIKAEEKKISKQIARTRLEGCGLSLSLFPRVYGLGAGKKWALITDPLSLVVTGQVHREAQEGSATWDHLQEPQDATWCVDSLPMWVFGALS